MAERRLICQIDSEPGPRTARSLRNLQNPWNDLMRTVQRTWKAHGRRAKSWGR
jgi:hypothetical protein